MDTPPSNKLIRDGLIYGGLMLAAVIIPNVLSSNNLSANPTDWATATFIAFGASFALSTVLWLIDRQLPRLVGGSAQRKQLATLIGWLIIAGAMFFAFTLLKSG